MPVFAAAFVVVVLATVATPMTNGFVGVFMVICGAHSSTYLGHYHFIDAALASFGVVLLAVVMVRASNKLLFGPLRNPDNLPISDLKPREILAITPLVVLIFAMGLFPSTFLSRSSQAVADFHTRSRLVWMRAQDHSAGPPRLLTNEMLAGKGSGMASRAVLELLERLDEGRFVPNSSQHEPLDLAKENLPEKQVDSR
jgi:formate hydrogenlyase subunit 3/multisubunit Na+/H+ antiporter MnhD subunit